MHEKNVAPCPEFVICDGAPQRNFIEYFPKVTFLWLPLLVQKIVVNR